MIVNSKRNIQSCIAIWSVTQSSLFFGSYTTLLVEYYLNCILLLSVRFFMKNLVSRQVSKNVFIVYVYVLSSFCILLNPVIDGLKYLDEAIVLFLALCATRRLSFVLCREARIIFLVLCGYLLYSLIIESNIFQAILLDFILFLKPFICLYVVYSYDTQIPLSFKKKLCRLYKYIGVIL